jgi:Beta-propeller repeat
LSGLIGWMAATSYHPRHAPSRRLIDTGHSVSVSAESQANRAWINDAYGRVPLNFEANEGQNTPEVKFLSRGSGYSLFLTSHETTLALRKSHREASVNASQRSGHVEFSKSEATVVRMILEGSSSASQIRGTDELPGKSNYLLGNDPKNWHTNIRHYSKVKYDDVYPGIDLVYYGTGRQLEYDFIVAPGANPQDIKLRFEGVRDLQIDADGDLVLDVEDGKIRQHKPIVYQELAGVRQEISGRYVQGPQGLVGFQTANYDASRPLVIDPVLVYSTYLGGSGDDASSRIAVDRTGCAYMAGQTVSVDFPTTAGALQSVRPGPLSAFVTKLNESGSAVIYSTYFGGSSNNRVYAIAVDGAGHAYVTGNTISRDFPITPGAFQPVIADASFGIGDAFVTKFDESGSALVYSTYLGGSGHESGSGIAVDRAGHAYVIGNTLSVDFPTTLGAFQVARAGSGPFDDVFVTKLNRQGSGLVYSSYLGGNKIDIGYAIAVDRAGYAYVTGQTRSLDFPITPGAFQLTNHGGPFDPIEAFVAKFNRQGTALVYSTYLGGTNDDFGGKSIAVDATGHAYVTGDTVSADFPTTPNAFQRTNNGGGDVFVTKLNRRGSALRYSTFLGGGGSEQSPDIAIDGAGHAYVSGLTSSPDFPTTPVAIQGTRQGGFDAFVTKLNRRGSALLTSTYLGGTGDDFGTGIAVDRARNAYVLGYTFSRDFPVVPGAFQPAHGGGLLDVFVTKIRMTGDSSQDEDDGGDDEDEDEDSVN